MDGTVSDNMRRVNVKPRENWKKLLRDDGFDYYDLPGLKWTRGQIASPDEYWTEEGAIEISQAAEKELLEATFELHNLALEAVDRVVRDDVMLHLFEIPPELWPAVRKSWENKKTDMLGRMDLAWDGKGPPKLLEYNGDTPSVLTESAAPQLHWMRDMRDVRLLDKLTGKS